MTEHGPGVLDALSPHVGPVSPVIISPVAPTYIPETVKPIDFSPKPVIDLSQGSNPALESHGDAGNALRLNVNHPGAGVVLGEKGAENLQVHRKKRRKLGDQCDNLAGKMEDLVDWPESHSLQAQDESMAQKPKARKLRKPSQKSQNLEKTVNSSLKGKVTNASSTTVLVPTDKSAQDVSRKCDFQDEAGDSLDWETHGLQLEEATTRRSYWTPIKDTNPASINLTGTPVPTQAREAQAKSKDFRSLMSEFSFSRENSREVEVDCQLVTEGPTTKQLLEFIPPNCRTSKYPETESLDTGISSNSEGNGKHKSTKRAKQRTKSRITTITSLTTGRYESPFASQGGDTTSLGDHMAESIQLTNKIPSKRKTTKMKSKKSVQAEYQAQFKPAPTVEALKTIENQALLFGTSSQLERESSPSVYGLDTELEHDQTDRNSNQSISRESSTGLGVSRFSKSKNLWGASSRDLDGYLLDVEVIDLVDPEAPKVVPKHGDEQQSNHSNKRLECTTQEERLQLGEHGSAEETKRPACAVERIIAPDTTRDPSGNLDISKDQTRTIPTTDSMPEYHHFSTPDLAKKLASFGFRPIKKREKMIELLEKCWASKRKGCNGSATEPMEPDKSQPITQLTPSNANPGFLDSGSARKGGNAVPKGTTKPEKTTSKGMTNPTRSSRPTAKNLKGPSQTTDNISDFMNSQFDIQPAIIEIEDSTDESLLESPKQPKDGSVHSSFSHPPSSHIAPQKPSPPPQTVLVRTRASGNPNKKEPADPSSIFIQITNAVKAQPRMRSINGVKQPTWHEKIVMYDPIWLDDFTLWLNVEGFKRIKEDREVYPSLVREWCESKGICCCFRNKK